MIKILSSIGIGLLVVLVVGLGVSLAITRGGNAGTETDTDYHAQIQLYQNQIAQLKQQIENMGNSGERVATASTFHQSITDVIENDIFESKVGDNYFVTVRLVFRFHGLTSGNVYAVLPEGFRPAIQVSAIGFASDNPNSMLTHVKTINTDGTITGTTGYSTAHWHMMLFASFRVER